MNGPIPPVRSFQSETTHWSRKQQTSAAPPSYRMWLMVSSVDSHIHTMAISHEARLGQNKSTNHARNHIALFPEDASKVPPCLRLQVAVKSLLLLMKLQCHNRMRAYTSLTGWHTRKSLQHCGKLHTQTLVSADVPSCPHIFTGTCIKCTRRLLNSLYRKLPTTVHVKVEIPL